MNKTEGLTLEEIFKGVEGGELKEKRGSKLYFRMYLNQEMSDSPLEVLDLSVRSYNVLKRAGYNTVGELAEAIADGASLARLKNCGSKSVREIMEALFVYQYQSLDPRRRDTYLKETIALTRERNKKF